MTTPREHATEVWPLAHLLKTGRLLSEVRGAPCVVDGPDGHEAVAFDGRSDALIFPSHPLIGAACFTVEVILSVAPGGPAEQRLLHLQASEAPDRLLLETRRGDISGGTWFADSFFRTSGLDHILADPTLTHPAGAWTSLALVCDGAALRQFVNGRLELESPCTSVPIPSGCASLGMRINSITPFCGLISSVRFSRHARGPQTLWPQPAGVPMAVGPKDSPP